MGPAVGPRVGRVMGEGGHALPSWRDGARGRDSVGERGGPTMVASMWVVPVGWAADGPQWWVTAGP
jgi:hypothetical protein